MVDSSSSDQTLQNPAYWSDVLNAAVVGCRAEKLTRGYSPSLIHRVHLEYASAANGVPSVICKDSSAPWPNTDPDGLHREWFVYSECLSRLPSIGPALLHVEHATEGNRLVLADLDIDQYFPPHEHVWTREELKPALEVLALLHVAAASLPLEEYTLLMPAPDRRWEDHAIQNAVRILADDRTYGHQGRRLLPAVELLLRRAADQSGVWQQASRTLLHSDFNCSNVALERSGMGPARLIDWHIAASGMPAFEIASVFFQPYHNHRNLDRRAVLDDYLEARQKLGGEQVHRDEEWGAFCYATASDGLSYLPPVARQLQTTGALQGWWSNMLAAIVDNLTWCAAL